MAYSESEGYRPFHRNDTSDEDDDDPPPQHNLGILLDFFKFQLLETTFLNKITDSDGDDAPRTHLLPNTPVQRKNRWHHIQDLDTFFTRVYDFHQQHGLLCMMLESAFEIIRFVFIIWFTTELRNKLIMMNDISENQIEPT